MKERLDPSYYFDFRAIASSSLFDALMLILSESNNTVAELIMKGLSEIVRVGDDIAKEKGEVNPYLLALKPKGITLTIFVIILVVILISAATNLPLNIYLYQRIIGC